MATLKDPHGSVIVRRYGKVVARFKGGEHFLVKRMTDGWDVYLKSGCDGFIEKADPAQSNLGVCFYAGEGVAKDQAEAVKWYRKAAEQNLAAGQHNLGVCYYNGEGVAKDQVEAVKWFRKAAEQNYAEAQYSLGNCYTKGFGVAKDQVEAVKWYRKAAEQNYVVAQYWLGVCYANGFGVAKDQAEAVKWYRKAADQNYAEAQYKLAGGASSNAGTEDNSSNNIGANERYSFRTRGNPWIVCAAFIAVTISAIWGLFQAVARRWAVIVIALAILVVLFVIPHGAGRDFVFGRSVFCRSPELDSLQIRGGKEVVFRARTGVKASTATKVGLAALAADRRHRLSQRGIGLAIRY